MAIVHPPTPESQARLETPEERPVHGTGSRPAEVRLTATHGDRTSRAAFQLRGRAAAEQLRIVAADPSDIGRGLTVDRLTRPGGSVIERITPPLH